MLLISYFPKKHGDFDIISNLIFFVFDKKCHIIEKA